MHVAVDANCLAWGWGGIPKVVDRVVRELATRDDVHVDLLANHDGPFADIPGVGQVARRLRGGPHWRERFVSPWVGRHRPDVLWAPEGVLPLRPAVPTVVTVHDLAALLFVGVKSRRHTLAYRTAVRRSVRRATRVIAVSATTAADTVRIFGVEPGRLRTVPNGVDDTFVPGDQEAARVAVYERFGLERPFVLAVGALEPRKGLDVLLDLAATATGWDVALAGSASFRSGELVRRAATLPACKLLGHVTDSELVELYRGAEALLAPSLYEGFGLTPLEAMASGTPAVIAGGSGGLEEVSGAAAVVVRERNASGWLDGIEEARRNRDELVTAGLALARRFRWPAVADATLAVLQEAASAPSADYSRGRWRKRTTPR